MTGPQAEDGLFSASTPASRDQRVPCEAHLEEACTISSGLSSKRNGNTSTFGALRSPATKPDVSTLVYASPQSRFIQTRQQIAAVRFHVPFVTSRKYRLVDSLQKPMPEMAVVFLRLHRRIGSFLSRVLDRNRMEYPRLRANENVVHPTPSARLLLNVPPCRLRAELRKPLLTQQRLAF